MADTDLKNIIKVEYKKCLEDPAYFAKNYCMIQHPVHGRDDGAADLDRGGGHSLGQFGGYRFDPGHHWPSGGRDRADSCGGSGARYVPFGG